MCELPDDRAPGRVRKSRQHIRQLIHAYRSLSGTADADLEIDSANVADADAVGLDEARTTTAV
jgi:hypothetical protein